MVSPTPVVILSIALSGIGATMLSSSIKRDVLVQAGACAHNHAEAKE